MRVSVEPVSAVPAGLLKDHLQRFLPASVIDWKYFDPAFRPRGERGYAWMRDGRVQGMIGLLPFQAAGPAGRVEASWTCDWFVEASVRNPGIGVLVLKEAIERAGLLLTLGGNEATSRLVPRLATHTVPGAGVEMSLSLTVGGTVSYGRVARRLPALTRLGLDRVRLARPAKAVVPAGLCLKSSPGIHPSVVALIEEGPATGWAGAYDAPYLEWQERCPVIEVASTCALDGARARAAALFWRARDDARRWRLALWMREGEEPACAAVLHETTQQIERGNGQVVSAIVACEDAATRGVLARAGFGETDHRPPFYVLARASQTPITGFSQLAYTDSDLGYRF